MKFRLSLLCLLATAILFPVRHDAHQLGQSYIILRIDGPSIEGRFEMTVQDLNAAVGLDFAEDHSVTPDQVDAHMEGIKAYLLNRVKLATNGQPVDFRLTEHRLVTIPLAQYVAVHFVLDDLSDEPKHIDIDYGVLFDIDTEHRGLLAIEQNWNTGTFNNEAMVSLVFKPSDQNQRLDLTSSSFWLGFVALVELGIHHIWVGIDHILFLLALLLPSVVHREDRNWEPVAQFRSAFIHVVKIVTLFTVAHSITLSLASLQLVELSPRLVESIIAISIAVAALDIIYPVFRGNIWWVVVSFGLFHGFGFASVLSSMGIPSRYMIASLFGFNLGVEIGQVAIVCLVFPVLLFMSRTKIYVRWVLPLGAVLLIVVSLYWFIERAFEFDLPAGRLLNMLLNFA